MIEGRSVEVVLGKTFLAFILSSQFTVLCSFSLFYMFGVLNFLHFLVLDFLVLDKTFSGIQSS